MPFNFPKHGFQLEPAVGEAVADLVLRDGADVTIAPLLIARFGSRCFGAPEFERLATRIGARPAS